MSLRSVRGHIEPISGADYSAVELDSSNEAVVMLDQRRLPEHELYLELLEWEHVGDAITDMVVRGAPAIGVAAAYALVLAARHGRERLATAGAKLCAARPTAVNLGWAVARMLARSVEVDDGSLLQALADEARSIHREDVAANRRIGQLGALRVGDGATILTHCNAGALATGGFGTALGVIRAAHLAGKRVRVLADETRPWLQGARLTAWELKRDGIPVSVIADSSSGSFFARGMIDLVIVGADRIASNGDVANKIGTYTAACLAAHHRVPFFVAAPWSTVDMSCSTGDRIPIEERPSDELTHFRGQRITPEGVAVHNPSFDVTPAALVTAIFTERGTVEPVGSPALSAINGAGLLG